MTKRSVSHGPEKRYKSLSGYFPSDSTTLTRNAPAKEQVKIRPNKTKQNQKQRVGSFQIPNSRLFKNPTPIRNIASYLLHFVYLNGAFRDLASYNFETVQFLISKLVQQSIVHCALQIYNYWPPFIHPTNSSPAVISLVTLIFEI